MYGALLQWPQETNAVTHATPRPKHHGLHPVPSAEAESLGRRDLGLCISPGRRATGREINLDWLSHRDLGLSVAISEYNIKL